MDIETNKLTLLNRPDVTMDQSMVASVYEILSRTSQDAPPEVVERIGRRLATAALHAMGVEYTKSLLAETIYSIKLEGDWEHLLDADGNPYQIWDDFHRDLTTALRVAESTSWLYQRLVRFAYEVLKIEPGEFADKGGLTTVRAMYKLAAGLDGRSTASFAETVRPATEHFREILMEYPGGSWAERMCAFFNAALAHDYNDPSAINLPPGDIYALVDESLGRPRVWWEWEDFPARIVGIALFPDQRRETVTLEVSGATATLLAALERLLNIQGG